jgi:hypothetical protein
MVGPQIDGRDESAYAPEPTRAARTASGPGDSMAFPFRVEHPVRRSPRLILAVVAVGVGIRNDVLEPKSVTVVAIR